MVGKTLNHYEVVDALGEGGMGEVYRARDTKLNRDVAIKVLPPHLADDAERLARMQREAQLLAALNHPNIAAIYGLEEAGDISFLAMELAEGQTLGRRLQDGALGIDEALKIALQVAEALEAAHERGIVHRDLKPDNIQVGTEGSATGQVKVLDFGLAKAYEADGASAEISPDLSASPTMAAATRTGVIMGTAAYMSPEQARGKPLDKRTDIWAFGCVVFEMLTGRRAFQGETVTDILAAIVHQEPQWEALPPETPLRIREVLRRCLGKSADERLRDVGECRIAVKEYLADPEGEAKRALASSAASVAGTGVAGDPWKLAAVVGVVALLVGSAGTWLALRPPVAAPAQLVDFPVQLPKDVRFFNAGRQLVAFSPDQSLVVFVGDSADFRGLFTRALGEMEIVPLRGTESEIGAVTPFFSPDGQNIGFFSDFLLMRVPATGGSPQLLADVSEPRLSSFGASWAADGNIYTALGPASGATTIMRIPEGGGELDEVVAVESGFVMGPQLLPGGEWLLFTHAESASAWQDAAIVVESVVNPGERRELFRGGTDARYIPSGHIVYAQENALRARRFDADSLEVGSSFLVRQGVWSADAGTGAAQWATSALGGLVYVPAIANGDNPVGLTWFSVDQPGEPMTLPPTQGRELWIARQSPVDDRIALVLEEPGSVDWSSGEIVIYEPGRRSWQEFATRGQLPAWAPDGEWLYYSGFDDAADTDIFRGRVGSTIRPERLLRRPGQQLVSDVAEDLLLFSDIPEGETEATIWTLELTDGAEPQLVIGESGDLREAVFSPDRGWIAYSSRASGYPEIWAEEFPPFGDTDRIKVSGGENASKPVWNEAGISYDSFGTWMLVEDLDPGPGFDPAPAQPLLRVLRGSSGRGTNYSVSADGKRVLVPRLGNAGALEGETPVIRVVLNWFDEVRRRTPVER